MEDCAEDVLSGLIVSDPTSVPTSIPVSSTYLFADRVVLVDVLDCAEGSWADEIDAWMTGINHNVGKSTRFVARYAGTIREFRRWCNEVRENEYSAF